MNYSDAQLNCQNKFGNLVGGLFEPRLANTNQLVYVEAAKFASIETTSNTPYTQHTSIEPMSTIQTTNGYISGRYIHYVLHFFL